MDEMETCAVCAAGVAEAAGDEAVVRTPEVSRTPGDGADVVGGMAIAPS
jgi:hypothetical protein